MVNTELEAALLYLKYTERQTESIREFTAKSEHFIVATNAKMFYGNDLGNNRKIVKRSTKHKKSISASI